MTPMDTTAAEADFRTLFAWIQAGHGVDALSGRHYRWQRDGYEATNMSTSPAGEFMCITGNGLVAYLRPKGQGYGHMRRVDLRAGTTADDLATAAARTKAAATP